MSEVLFGQSYYLCFDPKLWAAGQPYPPLGTLYAAAYLRNRGYDVALFDAMLAESEAGWEGALEKEEPRFAVLYEDNFNYLSKMCLLRMRQAAFTMIDFARRRGCTVIVAGSDPTDHAESYLEQGADYVLTGEGELTLGELLDALTGKSGASPAEIAGLVYRSLDGRTVRTPRRPDIKEVDSLPFPAWDLVNVARYREDWVRRHGYYSMNLATSRGCPYHCNWCAKPIWGQRYNTRSPENVADELRWLKKTYRPDHVWFADDIFGLKPGWLQRFADRVEQDGTRTPFKCLSRADLLLREGTISALARAGAEIVWIGAESGSQQVLDAMDKGTRVEQIVEASRSLHAAGIRVGFFLQFGYPGETRADIERTIHMVRACRPDDIGVSVSYPLPGTKFHEAVRDELGAKQNWTDSDDLAMLYHGPFTTDFYRRLHSVVHKEFRANRGWADARQAGRPWRRRTRSAAAALYHRLTLPAARRDLDRLARRPHQALDVRPQTLTPAAAAEPTPQSGEAGGDG